MTSNNRGKLIAGFMLAAGCLATLVLSVGLLTVRSTAHDPVSSALATALPAADIQARAAEAAFTARNWDEAERRSRLELAVSPAREDGWLRLARIDAARHGHLGPAGFDALSHTYDVAPYGVGVHADRRKFVQLHMVELPGNLRAEVEEESLTSVQ